MNWSKEWKAPVVPQRFLDQANNKEEQDIIELYGTEVNPHLLGVKEREQFIAGVRKIGTFRIKDGQSYHTFVGEVVGDLALDYSDDGWNIYHVPTLTKFTSAVPSYLKHVDECNVNSTATSRSCSCVPEISYEYEHDALLRWMAKVQTNYPTSWQMLALLTPTDYEDKAVRAKEIIKEWCLSVKVE